MLNYIKNAPPILLLLLLAACGSGSSAPADTDGDSRINKQDNCPDIANEDQLNTDATFENGDSLGDACDDDDDADGTPDSEDAFPLNPSESKDTDGDTVGDNSDAFPKDATETKDSDGDGVGDNIDVFPQNANETKDTDGDTVGDNSDAFPNVPTQWTDLDGDGVGDNNLDNCPSIANSDQLNTDATFENGDALGDACDDDIDADGVKNSDDDFPTDASETIDADKDGIGDNQDLALNNNDTTYVELDRLIETDRISTTFTGTELFDRLGLDNTFQNLGDINGDGKNDLAIIMTGEATEQSYTYEWHGNFYVHIILGGTPLPKDVTKANIESISDFKFVIGNATGHGNTGLIEVMPVGDYNNDGLQDFAILNKINIESEDIAEFNYGAMYLIYGRKTWPNTIEESSLMTDYGFRLTIKTYLDSELKVIKGAGDLNGDGFQDIFITFAEDGIYTNDLDNPDANAYFPYILFGSKDSPKGELDLDAMNGTRLIDTTQLSSSKLGAEIVSLGDFNGDQYDDFAILDSSYYTNQYDIGYLYVVYGKENWAQQTDLSTLTLEQGFVIAGYYNPEAGVSRGTKLSKIASAKDINGDGLNDFHINASFHKDSVDDEGGRGYDMIIFGGQQFPQVKNHIIDIQDDILFYPADNIRRRYARPQFINDVNGDNIADMLIGVRNYDDDLTEAIDAGKGGVYVIYGKQPFYTDLDFTQLTPEQGFFIHNKNGFSQGMSTEKTYYNGLGPRNSSNEAAALADGLGWQVGSLGDWDNNGTQDIYFTMPNYDTGGQQEGYGQGKIFIMPLDATLYGAQ